jgi:hypothetical protein
MDFVARDHLTSSMGSEVHLFLSTQQDYIRECGFDGIADPPASF